MVSLIGAMLVVFSFALTGHAAAHDLRWIRIDLLPIHPIIVTLWFGALLPLLIALRDETVDATSTLVDAFSILAEGLVLLIILASLGMSILLLAEVKNLWTPRILLL